MKSIIINFGEDVIQTALVEDSRLVELLFDDREKETIVGNIYLGVVKNVLKNQFAFVDIGYEKNAFLDLSDSKEQTLRGDKKLKMNNHILIQISRDATGEKGAAATTQISVSDNCLVLFKSATQEIGVSKKIEAAAERKRLKKMTVELLPCEFSLIIRTSCDGITEDEMSENIQKLIAEYNDITARAEYSKAPCAMQKHRYVLTNTLNSLIGNDVDRIIVNDADEIAKIEEITDRIQKTDIELYEGETPVFTKYGIESQIDDALCRKVWLKSGGFIVIDHAEAGILIDVNSGKFIGKGTQQKTALKVDREAAIEIARQIRLRNLSGMILIDFIDLRFEENRSIILKELEDELKKDRINVSVIGMMGHGLVMLTRKKTREPLMSRGSMK